MRLFQLVRKERLPDVADIRFQRREDIHQISIFQVDIVRLLQARDTKSRNSCRSAYFLPIRLDKSIKRFS